MGIPTTQKIWVSGKRNPTGFTLVELLVVLALIGAAASVAIPAAWQAHANLRLRLAAGSVARLFQQARGRALFERKTYRVIFPTGGETPSVLRLVREDGKSRDQVTLPPQLVLTGRRQHGAWTMELPPIHFFPNGSAEAMELDLRDARASHVQLGIQPLTGTVRITQIYRGN